MGLCARLLPCTSLWDKSSDAMLLMMASFSADCCCTQFFAQLFSTFGALEKSQLAGPHEAHTQVHEGAVPAYSNPKP